MVPPTLSRIIKRLRPLNAGHGREICLAAVLTFLKASVGLVCFEATRASLGSLLSTRRRSEAAWTSARQNPNSICSTLGPNLTPSRVNARRFISSQRLRDVRFVARLLRGRETRCSAERQTLAAASTAATQRSAAAAHHLKQRPPAPAGANIAAALEKARASQSQSA